MDGAAAPPAGHGATGRRISPNRRRGDRQFHPFGRPAGLKGRRSQTIHKASVSFTISPTIMLAVTPMKHAKAYGQMAVNTRATTTDPHGLIEMLFDAVDEQLAIALGTLDTGDAERRGKAVSKAVMLLQEGLRGGLDLDKGGELAQQLDALYEYCAARLVEAHTRRDRATLQEVREHLRTVAEGWKAIRPQ